MNSTLPLSCIEIFRIFFKTNGPFEIFRFRAIPLRFRAIPAIAEKDFLRASVSPW
jgi:hypothetical protein